MKQSKNIGLEIVRWSDQISKAQRVGERSLHPMEQHTGLTLCRDVDGVKRLKRRRVRPTGERPSRDRPIRDVVDAAVGWRSAIALADLLRVGNQRIVCRAVTTV